MLKKEFLKNSPCSGWTVIVYLCPFPCDSTVTPTSRFPHKLMLDYSYDAFLLAEYEWKSWSQFKISATFCKWKRKKHITLVSAGSRRINNLVLSPTCSFYSSPDETKPTTKFQLYQEFISKEIKWMTPMDQNT